MGRTPPLGALCNGTYVRALAALGVMPDVLRWVALMLDARPASAMMRRRAVLGRPYVVQPEVLTRNPMTTGWPSAWPKIVPTCTTPRSRHAKSLELVLSSGTQAEIDKSV